MAPHIGERLASVRIGPVRYNSPWTQVAILGFVCFLSPGLFNALSGLGAGGQQDVALVDTANGLLYGVFCLTGFVAGSINNVLGPRITLCLGTCGYSLYAGSLWAFDKHHNRGFVIAAGGILGLCAGLLWTAQGAIMMSYPAEKDKGRAFSVFWAVFTMGGVVGSAIAFGMSFDLDKKATKTPTSVYVVFVILMLCAIGVVWFILPANYVVRGDGTLVELQSSLKMKEELSAFAQQFKDWRMLLLFPMFFTSNYFYAYQGSIVSYMFNGRTRALSSLLSNLGAVIGAIIIGLILDYCPGDRRRRAIVGWGFVVISMCGVWGGGIHFQRGWYRAEDANSPTWGYDFKQNESRGPLALMFFYYCVDSFYQGLAYYIMSSLTNDPFKLARMAGYYKGVQSAGAAVSFAMDAVHTPYMTEVIVSFVIMLASLPLALLVILKTPDTNVTAENTVKVEDLTEGDLHHVAIPKGHHTLDEHAVAEKGTFAKDGDHVEVVRKVSH